MNHSENLRGMSEFPNDVTADYLLDMAASMEHYEERIAELEETIDGRYEKHMAMVQRIAELEQENGRWRSQLASDKKQAYAEGINAGMERAADIALECSASYVCATAYEVADLIRKEIDNEQL